MILWFRKRLFYRDGSAELRSGTRHCNLALQFSVTRIKLQCSLISAQRIFRPSRAHVSVAHTAKTELAGKLFSIGIRCQWRRLLISPESVVIGEDLENLASVLPPQEALGLLQRAAAHQDPAIAARNLAKLATLAESREAAIELYLVPAQNHSSVVLFASRRQSRRVSAHLLPG